MKKFIFTLIIGCFFIPKSFGQTEIEYPTAYVSIKLFFGKHNISFKDYKKSKGLGFGLNLSLGLYIVNENDYRGGLQFTMLEGASFEKKRRQTSEDFKLPNKEYDKHIIFKFSQFRAANVGWFNELHFDNNIVYHRLGFGIFGTTEKDQLFDFAMHNALGLIKINKNNTRFEVGLSHDKQIGIGNPNYSMNNTAITIGGFGNF